MMKRIILGAVYWLACLWIWAWSARDLSPLTWAWGPLFLTWLFIGNGGLFLILFYGNRD